MITKLQLKQIIANNKSFQSFNPPSRKLLKITENIDFEEEENRSELNLLFNESILFSIQDNRILFYDKNPIFLLLNSDSNLLGFLEEFLIDELIVLEYSNSTWLKDMIRDLCKLVEFFFNRILLY
tara:strand:+ start:660 stop:1034 length:375 start_codon:yes stop_codon:yes gene_type:complete